MKPFLLGCLLLLSACSRPAGPEAVTAQFFTALEQGDIEKAQAYLAHSMPELQPQTSDELAARRKIFARIKHADVRLEPAKQPDGMALVQLNLTTVDALGMAVGQEQGTEIPNDPADWPTRTAPLEILLTSLPEDHGEWKITSVDTLQRALQGYTGL